MEPHGAYVIGEMASLEEAQRFLALARIGGAAPEAAARRSLAAIVEFQASRRRAGYSALGLEPARKAAALLVTGHRPDVDLCVAGVRVLGAVLAEVDVATGAEWSATKCLGLRESETPEVSEL